MKEGLLIKAPLAERITYWHLLSFAALLPYDRFYSELVLVSLLLHTLIHFRRTDLYRLNWYPSFFPAGIFLVTLTAMAWTGFATEALHTCERQLSLLLFPLIFLIHPFDYKRYTQQVLFAMALSCSVALVYLYHFAFGIIRFNHLPLRALFSNAFINHNFSAPIDMHATYFSMYIALAATGLVTCIRDTQNKAWRWLYGAMLILLCAGLLQLSSRAVLIAMAIVVNMVMPFWLSTVKQRKIFFVAVLLLSGFIALLFSRMEDLHTRFVVELKEDLTQNSIRNNTLEPRAVRWQRAWELVKAAPVTGHGSGSEVPLLKEIYFRDKLYNSYLNQLNAHNQYLSQMIQAGIIGLLVLLAVFITGFRYALQNRDLCFCSFLVLTATVCFSENILDANKGIFFFAFFYSLFYIGGRKKRVMQLIQK